VEGIEAKFKTQGPHMTSGLFDKDRLEVNVTDRIVTCPAGVMASIGRSTDGGLARFAEVCSSRALRPQCTKAAGGRSILVRPSEAVLVRTRACHKDPAWIDDYRATRLKAERKLAHLMRRRHGGRRTRVRGRVRVDADFRLLVAAVDLERLGIHDTCLTPVGWNVAEA
jgi:hypothetical protein